MISEFISLKLVVFTCIALCQCRNYQNDENPYDTADPSVQQVNLASFSNLANIEQYLNGASPVPPAQLIGSNSGYTSSHAPVTSINLPEPVESSASAAGAPYLSAFPGPSSENGAAGATYSQQPAWATPLYAGQHNYRAYQSPRQYKTVTLPIVPSSPVAKLYVPKQSSYAASGNAYRSNAYRSNAYRGNLAAAANPISFSIGD